ncbi:hypothetical protein SLEP1_g53739 [Rubroshorea leprosula]|uniref:Uncharacterized protein n=1 Tax=Rubroshorea leprosula TaxID=152421 RepID=A0AAV5MB50_9ROSI|nr:hypothetical protein SLEP1_g53739 [Rubroshorea leprosula]
MIQAWKMMICGMKRGSPETVRLDGGEKGELFPWAMEVGKATSWTTKAWISLSSSNSVNGENSMESPSNPNFWEGNGHQIRFAEDQFPSISQQNLQMEPVRQESDKPICSMMVP